MSFVSENNSLSGYKTGLEALKHPMHTYLPEKRGCSTQDAPVAIARPVLKTPPSGDLGQHDFFDHYFGLNVFKV